MPVWISPSFLDGNELMTGSNLKFSFELELELELVYMVLSTEVE
jgi:hypothetical protein